MMWYEIRNFIRNKGVWNEELRNDVVWNERTTNNIAINDIAPYRCCPKRLQMSLGPGQSRHDPI